MKNTNPYNIQKGDIVQLSSKHKEWYADINGMVFTESEGLKYNQPLHVTDINNFDGHETWIDILESDLFYPASCFEPFGITKPGKAIIL